VGECTFFPPLVAIQGKKKKASEGVVSATNSLSSCRTRALGVEKYARTTRRYLGRN